MQKFYLKSRFFYKILECRNLCLLEEFDCLSKQMTALLHRTRHWLSTYMRYNSSCIDLSFPRTHWYFKESNKQLWKQVRKLNCCPSASINLRCALKLFLVQTTLHLSPFKQRWYKISEKGAENEAKINPVYWQWERIMLFFFICLAKT